MLKTETFVGQKCIERLRELESQKALIVGLACGSRNAEWVISYHDVIVAPIDGDEPENQYAKNCPN